MKKIHDWYAHALGGRRNFYILIAMVALARILDIASTYYFLTASGWNFEHEANHFFRWMFYVLGFWPSIVINLVLSIVLVTGGAGLIFLFSRKVLKSVKKAQTYSAGVFVLLALLSVLIAIDNIGIDVFGTLRIYDVAFAFAGDSYVVFVTVFVFLFTFASYAALSLYRVVWDQKPNAQNLVDL